MSLAAHPFWLDGGYDEASVEGCPHHPWHDWWIFRIRDVIAGGEERWGDERMVICRSCYVPRCGYTTEPDPCILPRHHRCLHLTASGSVEDALVWPGSEKPAPPVSGGDEGNTP